MDDASVDTLAGPVEDVMEQRAGVPARYEDDLHARAMEQAEPLKAGRLSALDPINLADEVADVGHSRYDKLESDLARVIQHLLTGEYQPGRRSRSWMNAVVEHPRRVERHLRENPGLKALRDEVFQEVSARPRGCGDRNRSAGGRFPGAEPIFMGRGDDSPHRLARTVTPRPACRPNPPEIP